ncbi:MAG: hypothetical protein NC340_05710 [Ruminococcus flavefaciens]|nr:hypothetical protein [Ruminococcus flavefaciens]MCM1230541.1 hypothetical protein [Ruminococcus flavefaciens]
MGFLGLIKKFFRSAEYCIDRDILVNYVNESIAFAKEENLSFVDEFFLFPDINSDGLHVIIINYDAPCENPLESEENLSGILIFVNHNSQYNPEKDEKFYTVQELVSAKLSSYPEKFIMSNEHSPSGLEEYLIKE